RGVSEIVSGRKPPFRSTSPPPRATIGYMPRPRRFLFLSLAAVVVGLAFAWLLWPRTAITRENGARLRPGMALAGVEQIMGGPQRFEFDGTSTLDESAAGAMEAWREFGARVPPEAVHNVRWNTVSVSIVAWFDREDRMVVCHVLPTRSDETVPEMM